MSCSLLLSCLCWCVGKILYVSLPPIINEWNSMKTAPGMWFVLPTCSSCAYNTNNTATHAWSRTPQGSFSVMQFQKVFCFMVHKFWTRKHCTKFKCPIFWKATIKLLKFCQGKKNIFLFWTGEKCSIRIWATWIEF